MNNHDWLAQTEEAALDPQRPICDPHHHLWDRDGSRYLIHELLEDLDCGHNVVSTVFVECASMYRADGPEALRCVGETEFVNGVAAMSASGGYGPARLCAGIVGFADLSLGSAVDEVLAAHCAASSRFRGIRHAAAFDPSDEIPPSHTHPPPRLYDDARFREGFARLADHGLSFEAWQYHHQLDEVTRLARAFPEVTIVLNHLGGPLGIGPWAGRRDEIFTQWRRDLAECARCDNVVMKLGGILMRRNGYDFHDRPRPPSSADLADTTGPWYAHAMESFGAERCMFESNFPVDRISTSYGVLWNSFKRLAAGCSPAEQDALFHDTATRVYRLQQPTATVGVDSSHSS